MRGPRLNVVLISCAHVTTVVPVTMSTSEKSASANAEGLKMWTAPAVAFPADERLAEEADGDEQELEGEPVVLEPQEQVGAEDDRDRPEAEPVGPRRDHESSMSNA